MYDLLIRNGTVVAPDGVREADVAVEDGRIVDVAAGLRGGGREEIDATDLHVFPGVIDAHVHFNEPGRTEWEGFATGSAGLAAGGGTCFFEMPLNASPPTLDGPTFDAKRAAAEASSLTDFALWGGLTPANVDRLEELADRGVIGFKAFMSNSGIDEFGAVDDYTLYRGMRVAAERGLIVALHAENDAITGGLARDSMAAGRTTVDDYLASRPVVAEVEAIRRAITIATDTKCKLHIVHVSSEEGSQAAHGGRTDADVTYETCPHYLWFTEDDVRRIGARAKCAPPIRSAHDRAHLRFVLGTGEITFVASDHSPAPASMKTDANFFKVWGGIAGVQSTLAVMLSLRPPLPLPAVAGYTAGRVAERFGIPAKGSVAVGKDADLTLVSPGDGFTLEPADLHDRHKLSPYVGEMFNGVVRRTISRGQTIFLDGKIVGRPMGQLVKPARSL
jgi:allantoinase